MEDITRDEYLNKREEYQISKKVASEVQHNFKNVEPLVSNKTEPIINNAASRPNQEKTTTSSSFDENSEMNNILKAINDTSLPSKQPLHENDQFVYISSKSYMLSFVLVSLVLIGIMNIMN